LKTLESERNHEPWKPERGDSSSSYFSSYFDLFILSSN